MKKALIIEDNQNNRRLMEFILEKSGFTTVSAENGKEGIEYAIRERPDFIILDIQLPDMDGLKVAELIRNSEIDGEIPIIATTSFAMPGDREKILAAGCNGYIEKPIDPLTIISQIRVIITKSHEYTNS